MDMIYEGSATGLTLHCLFRDASDSVVDLTEQAGDKVRVYTVTEAALVAAGVAAGTHRPLVLTGTASSHNIAVDTRDGFAETFYFDGVKIIDLAVPSLPVSQVPVPAERTLTLRNNGSGWVGDRTLSLRVGEEKIFSVDFRKDFPLSGRFSTVGTIAIESGAVGGVTFNAASQGVDRDLLKFEVTGVIVGTYVIELPVTYAPNNEVAKPLVTLEVIA